MTDKEVNVRNEWGGIEETAKSEKTTTRPWFLLSDIFLYPINSSSSPSLTMLLRVFLRLGRGIFAIRIRWFVIIFDYRGLGLASKDEKNRIARGVLRTGIWGLGKWNLLVAMVCDAR